MPIDSDKGESVDSRIENIERSLNRLVEKNSISMNYSPSGALPNARRNEIDLMQLIEIVKKGKIIIVISIVIFAITSFAYSLYLPNIYRSEALLTPAHNTSELGAVGQRLGGLASLAGMDLGGATVDKATLAIEILKSREFIKKFIRKYDLLIPIMAAKRWDENTNELKVDYGIYDPEENKWKKSSAHSLDGSPSHQQAYNRFIGLLNVEQDKLSKLVRLSVEFYSPSISKQWVDWLVEDINSEIRAKDVAEAERSIQYLQSQLEKTPIADMKTVLYNLIEEQAKTIMFAESRHEYVFKTLDPAVIPESKISPNRTLILSLGILLGIIFSMFFLFTKHYFEITTVKNKRS